MKIQSILLAILCFTFGIASAQKEMVTLDKQDFSIGETVKVHSKVLHEDRILNIYLPDSYRQDSLKKYPVIYLLDGSRDEDFIHISGLVQFGSFSWINMIPETIVVGISNVDRKRDFTFPTSIEQDQIDFPSSGQSKNFITFIEKELQPYIDLSYRTTPTKTIIGQSLGGLLATEILFKKPTLFDHYIIVSPSLWWDDESLLQLSPKRKAAEKAIYIAVGREGEIMERTATELHQKLKGAVSGTTPLYFEFFEDKNHGDALHHAVYNAFVKLFQQEGE
ncbi:alpha/beta hydrolase-fold protein [Limibacter armeniacum]|uniref:alpha/beta hydrolase n=1 Tax=Limibacter armeniacum TaxID=466084 RepID=UPI002FE58B7C